MEGASSSRVFLALDVAKRGDRARSKILQTRKGRAVAAELFDMLARMSTSVSIAALPAASASVRFVGIDQMRRSFALRNSCPNTAEVSRRRAAEKTASLPH